MSLDPSDSSNRPAGRSSNRSRDNRDSSSASSPTSGSTANAGPSTASTSSGIKALLQVSEQANSLIKTLFSMQQSGLLCDVNFVLDDGSRIPAHRAVLSAGSRYFRALFSSNMMESISEEIPVSGIRSAFAFRLMLEFLYTGRIMPPAADSMQSSDEVPYAILAVLELADLYAIDSLFNACTSFLKQRITVANCVNWLCFTTQSPNFSELYQSCLAFYCSRLNEFPRTSVDTFDADLMIAVVSSECLKVSSEVEVLELVGQWLIASHSLTNSHNSHPTSTSAASSSPSFSSSSSASSAAPWASLDEQDAPMSRMLQRHASSLDDDEDDEDDSSAMRVATSSASPPLPISAQFQFQPVLTSRSELFGARVLRHVRFSQIPLHELESFAMRLLSVSPSVYSVFNQCLLEQLSEPYLDTSRLGSASDASSSLGWSSSSRFYSIPLYDRQSATVFKQAPDAGLVRAIVLSPDRSLLFAGSASTSSAEMLLPLMPNAPLPGAGGPEPCLRIWNTQTWECEQSLPCGTDDIVALVVQEYSSDVYLVANTQYMISYHQAYTAKMESASTSSSSNSSSNSANSSSSASSSTVPNEVHVDAGAHGFPSTSTQWGLSSLFQSFLFNSTRSGTPVSSSSSSTGSPSAETSSSSIPPPPPLPNFQIISAQVSRPSHHHNPRLRLRVWEFQPNIAAIVSGQKPTPDENTSKMNFNNFPHGKWHCTKDLSLSPAFVKNPVLFVVDSTHLLVGNYRHVQIWHTRYWLCEREFELDATLRGFVNCSCGHELLARSVRDIRAWDTNTWLAVRVMPAKLLGDHKAKLASCLQIHRNRMLFPMHDCIISADPHTGAYFQRFELPPDPKSSSISLAPSLLNSALRLPSAVALNNPDAWVLSSFVMAGDLLVVATYQGWLSIFSLSYTDTESVPPMNEQLQQQIRNALQRHPLLQQYANDGLIRLHCERYWQTAGSARERGAIVNALAVVTSSNASNPNSAAASLPVSSSASASSSSLSAASSAAAAQGNDAASMMDASSTSSASSSSSSSSLLPREQSENVAGVVTVLDYGNSLTVWRRCEP